MRRNRKDHIADAVMQVKGTIMAAAGKVTGNIATQGRGAALRAHESAAGRWDENAPSVETPHYDPATGKPIRAERVK